MIKKNSGFNILGFITLSFLLGFTLLSVNQTPLGVAQKSQMHRRIERILVKESFLLKGDLRSEFVDYLVATAKEYRFDPFLILAIMKIESAFDPMAVSFAGAYGLLQIKPIAAEEVSIVYQAPRIFAYQLFDPFINLRTGVQYLAYLRDVIGSNRIRMLSAYNLGPTWVKRRRWHSRKYAKKVLRAYEYFTKLASSV